VGGAHSSDEKDLQMGRSQGGVGGQLPETGKRLGNARVSEAAQRAQPSIYFIEAVREKLPREVPLQASRKKRKLNILQKHRHRVDVLTRAIAECYDLAEQICPAASGFAGSTVWRTCATTSDRKLVQFSAVCSVT
jgi:hypothetical protein